MTPEVDGIDSAQAQAAEVVARACGVTRLADITGLDRVGVPVFQAIRPASRALSVHQGKGFTTRAARLGAAMEAIESAHAEAFDVCSGVAAHRDLPAETRPACLADFASNRAAPLASDEPLAWTTARRLVDGSALHVPLDCVSLDYSRGWDRRLDHTSTGLGARFDEEGAVLKGLLEVIERDAVWAWRREPPMDRALRRVAGGSLPYPWFRDLAEHLAEASLGLSLFAIPSVVGLTVVRAEIVARGGPARASARAGGMACALEPESALRGAVLEALQSRLALIAGSRDDIYYRGHATAPFGDAWPLPPGVRPLDWTQATEGGGRCAPASMAQVVDRLAAEGYPDACAATLSPPDCAVWVSKVFVPGLGSDGRVRRPGRGR
jgi:ribosomal protein S12 methylthiotransferase accessory factor